MATSSVGKKTLLLGLLVATLVATASCAATSGASNPAAASVTISNPARVIVNVLVGDKDVKVATDVTTVVKLDHPEQDLQIQTPEGRATVLHVQDGDVLVLYPDPDDSAHLSIQVLSNPAAVVKPSVVTPMKPGIRAPPSPSR